jgi:hypothetical protein
MGCYSQLEIDALGFRGKALLIKGRYARPIQNRRDLLNAIAAWRQLRPGPEALEVKAWVKRRAIHLKMEELLPANWQLKIPATIDDSLEPDG